jgi:triosephosphate isomerase
MVAKRSCIIIGNWKMHKTIEEAEAFVNGLLTSYSPSDHKKIGLAVPYTAIYPLRQLVSSSSILSIGAQNMNDASEGAFTGEIAGTMLKEAGAEFVILGHSERRRLYAEDNACINKKMKRAIETGLRPILCVGETEEELASRQTEKVIELQLREGLKDLNAIDLRDLVIAYEPVWAIGTGNPASPAVAQATHQFCRRIIANLLSLEFAEQTVIQYGGSINAANAQILLAQSDIDGLLIGGASLSLATFLHIINQHYAKLSPEE